MATEDQRAQLDHIVDFYSPSLPTNMSQADAEVLGRVANSFCCAIMVLDRDSTDKKQYIQAVRKLLVKWHADKNTAIDKDLKGTQKKYAGVIHQLSTFLVESLQSAREGLKANFCSLSRVIRFS